VLWLPRATVSGKKIAAVAALFATLVYLIISGFAVPTQRAFIMIALVFLAVLADREALSLRLVALSALAIIALRPDAVMGVSFQLSFAAVTALIAVYESWRPEFDRHRPWWSRIGRYFMLSIFTTLIATVATTPIVIYHFHQMTLQGALADAGGGVDVVRLAARARGGADLALGAGRGLALGAGKMDGKLAGGENFDPGHWRSGNWYDDWRRFMDFVMAAALAVVGGFSAVAWHRAGADAISAGYIDQ